MHRQDRTTRLANYLASVRGVQRPVVDRTMLNGVYGFTLTYATADPDDRPDIFTALPEQLGLRLQVTRASIERWVIDHVERPSANWHIVQAPCGVLVRSACASHGRSACWMEP